MSWPLIFTRVRQSGERHGTSYRRGLRRRSMKAEDTSSWSPMRLTLYVAMTLGVARNFGDSGGGSKTPAPTPVSTEEMIIVASGWPPERPIFAIRPGATGDITLSSWERSNEFVAWHRERRGPYMPTPVVYRGMLYSLDNGGILDAYDLQTGKDVYRQRIEHAGFGFSASPVVSDGMIYLSSEDGDIFVVRAGSQFELLSRNPIGEPLLATPALSEGTMYVRGARHLFAIGSTSSQG